MNKDKTLKQDTDTVKLERNVKKNNKLKPCKENNLISDDGQIRESIGLTDKARILLE
jgi:hypothetical protein